MLAEQNNRGELVCPVSFKNFFFSTLLGNIAMVPARAIARKLYESEPETTKATAANVLGISAFWLVGGMAYIWLTKRI
jgi:hypothetical protein